MSIKRLRIAKLALVAALCTVMVVYSVNLPSNASESTAGGITAPKIETESEMPLKTLTKRWEDIPLSAELQQYIIDECKERNIRPEIIIAMIGRESTYRADEIGDNEQAFGLMQIHPRWHYMRMLELDCTNLLDPFQNVTVGIDYLDELIDMGRGIEWALTAYNGGFATANKLAAQSKISSYARLILNDAERLA